MNDDIQLFHINIDGRKTIPNNSFLQFENGVIHKIRQIDPTHFYIGTSIYHANEFAQALKSQKLNLLCPDFVIFKNNDFEYIEDLLPKDMYKNQRYNCLEKWEYELTSYIFHELSHTQSSEEIKHLISQDINEIGKLADIINSISGEELQLSNYSSLSPLQSAILVGYAPKTMKILAQVLETNEEKTVLSNRDKFLSFVVSTFDNPSKTVFMPAFIEFLRKSADVLQSTYAISVETFGQSPNTDKPKKQMKM